MQKLPSVDKLAAELYSYEEHSGRCAIPGDAVSVQQG